MMLYRRTGDIILPCHCILRADMGTQNNHFNTFCIYVYISVVVADKLLLVLLLLFK